MRSRTRSGFTLIELLTVIAIIGILAAALFPAINSVKKKAKISTGQTTFQQWCAGVTRYKSVYGFYPNIGTSYATATDSLHKLETGAGLNFVKALYGKNPSGTPLSGTATGERAKFNRNAEEFCAFGKDDYELFDASVNTAGKLMDKFGNINIRVVFDTDGNGTIKSISTPLPDDLSATKNPNGIDSTTGVPARVIIFTTIRDVGSSDNSLGADDVADIIAIQ
jgi:prepilin-type N-terminal cleavage/methylation domain-containing protein